MDMSVSLSSLLLQYPFEKYKDLTSLTGVHGVFLLICCEPVDGGINCRLLDFGGSVDLKHAIETSIEAENCREKCRHPIDVMVAIVSPMNCEALLNELENIREKEQ
jgi:hypothetical protein